MPFSISTLLPSFIPSSPSKIAVTAVGKPKAWASYCKIASPRTGHGDDDLITTVFFFLYFAQTSIISCADDQQPTKSGSSAYFFGLLTTSLKDGRYVQSSIFIQNSHSGVSVDTTMRVSGTVPQ